MESLNRAYFAPRGLGARLVKDIELAQTLNIPASIQDNRSQALASYVAPLQVEGLLPLSQETDALDHMSAKMSERKCGKSDDKGRKDQNDADKKLQEKLQEIQKDRDKDADKINQKKEEEAGKLQTNIDMLYKEHERKTGEVVEKGEKAARKAFYIVIENA
ncbi:hypothetical protein H2203_008633 [Taxawa tesnikishii (nom. ined.)]|nr:hypothetical protein H2203_008633 [Dothideales sp. JES 119]